MMVYKNIEFDINNCKGLLDDIYYNYIYHIPKKRKRRDEKLPIDFNVIYKELLFDDIIYD